jgi:hypothetical protein
LRKARTSDAEKTAWWSSASAAMTQGVTAMTQLFVRNGGAASSHAPEAEVTGCRKAVATTAAAEGSTKAAEAAAEEAVEEGIGTTSRRK